MNWYGCTKYERCESTFMLYLRIIYFLSLQLVHLFMSKINRGPNLTAYLSYYVPRVAMHWQVCSLIIQPSAVTDLWWGSADCCQHCNKE